MYGLSPQVAPVGSCVPLAHGLWGRPGGSHALSPTQSQDATSLGSGPHRVGAAPHHPAAGPPRPDSVESPGQPTGSKAFSVPRRPWKAATAFWRKALTISGGCPSIAPRSGRCCLTSIVGLRMGRRPPRGCAGGDFLISLKRCYPISRFCLDLGNAIPILALSG